MPDIYEYNDNMDNILVSNDIKTIFARQNLFMSHYESVFILNPALSEDQVKDVIKKYEKLLKENNCNVVEVENWGLKKLAYKIQNKLSGFYVLIDFEKNDVSNIIDTYELELKRDERVMRFLNVKLDKDANKWAIKRRKKLKKVNA